MADNSKDSRVGLSPIIYGTVSLIAACLSWASIWLLLNMGPDGILNNRMFEAFAVGLLPLAGFVCGLFGVGTGIQKKNWFAIATSAIGVSMIAFEVLFLAMNR